MRYGQGGTHASVLPFMNFRMLGVFLVPAKILRVRFNDSLRRSMSLLREPIKRGGINQY